MSTFVFEWTRTVISQQYLDSMSFDSDTERNNVIKEMALTAKVKVEWNNKGQIFLEGAWEHIVKIHIMLVKYLKLPEQELDEDGDKAVSSPETPEPCIKSLLPSPELSPSVPKTNAKTVLCYFRQKYLNTNCQKSDLHLQRSMSVQSKKTVPEIEEPVSVGNDAIEEAKQENEVYVNITMSGDLGSITGLLLPVQDGLEHLSYQVPISESNELVSADGLLIQHEGILLNKSVCEDDAKCESSITVVDSDTVQSVQHYELSNSSVTEDTRRQLESEDGEEDFVEENVCVHKSTGGEHDGRTMWKHGQVTVGNDSTKPSDTLYSVSCEASACDDDVKETSLQGTNVQNDKKLCGKKKDYEKLAPFKFFCTLCSFKSKRESHYQRHLELHTKVSELFSCKKCDFTTIRLGHLRRHEMSHSDTKFACDMCHYHTDHHKFLLRHQRIKHANMQGHDSTTRKELLRCVECGYSTTRPYFYQRHLQAHASANSSLLRDEHRFHCQQCSYKTGRKEHYIRHVNNVHNNKRPYLCDHCGKAFKRPDALKQHRVTHVELDPSLGAFRCPVCGKCCRAQAQLTQHLAVHSNVRSFLCEICGSAFKTRAVQRKHVLTIHKNPKAFSCSQCSRKFNTKYALRRHMKQHSLDKKRKSGTGADEPAVDVSANKTHLLQTDSEGTLQVLQTEPILIQEAHRTQVHDGQAAITVQVIGFMPYSDT